MHVACDYVMHSSTMRRHASRKPRSMACLLVCYDQWWVSCVVDTIANCIHYSCWKEAIAVSSVHWELVRKRERQWQSANDARTFERSVFRESHTIKTLKTQSRTLWHLVVDVQTRYAADFMVTDRHTHKTTTVITPTAHAPRVNNEPLLTDLSLVFNTGRMSTASETPHP